MLKRGLLAIGVVAMVGCGGGEDLSEEEARLAWEATQGAMGGHDARPNALSVAAPCADGGKVKWKFNLGDSFGLGGFDNDGFDLEYVLKFKGCTHDNVKISGKLTYTISNNTSGAESSTQWGYHGNLRYSGDVSGSCRFEMFGEIVTTEVGGHLSYSGSICGNDAGMLALDF